MGSPEISPIAKIAESDVCPFKSTLTKPLLSSSTLVFSIPISSVFGRRPTDMSTRSKVSSFDSLADAIVT